MFSPGLSERVLLEDSCSKLEACEPRFGEVEFPQFGWLSLLVVPRSIYRLPHILSFRESLQTDPPHCRHLDEQMYP